MRILIIHNTYKIPGGEDTVVLNEKRLLEQHGHRVYLYTRSNNEIDSYSSVQKLIMPINTVFSFRSYKEVESIIKKNGIELVHVHNTVCAISPSVYYAAINNKIPVVQTIHNFRLLCPAATFLREGKVCDECVDKGLFHSCRYSCYRKSKIQTFALAFTETFHKFIKTYRKLSYICLTDFNREQFLRINNKQLCVEPSKVFVKPNFVFHDRSIIPYLKRKDQVIYAGRLDPSKGIKELFEAWLNCSRFSLIVCGTGPLEEWCRIFIKKNNIKNIKMMGFVPNDIVLKLISESKATILTTKWFEGFPMTLVESFSRGTPVIGSNFGNVGSIIIEGKNGFLIDPTSPKDIVQKVNNLYDICDSTYNTAVQLYSPERNYNLLMGIYEKVMSDHSRVL